MNAETGRPPGMWLVFGGLGVLALSFVLTLDAAALNDRLVFYAGTLAGYGMLGVGLMLGWWPKGDGAAGLVLPPPDAATRSSVPAAPTHESTHLARSMTTAFEAWQDSLDDHDNVWSAFDAFLRELIGECLDAARVRCFRVVAGEEQLQSLAQGERDAGPSARKGICGHVATSGRAFLRGDRVHGALVDQLAADEDWSWVWPIRANKRTIAVVAVGPATMLQERDAAERDAITRLVTLFWQQVETSERYRIVQRTDKASGVLTRQDFFDQANDALHDSYGRHEPVVAAIVALEGIRRLDDHGLWRERDTLIETMGKAIARQLRGDDLVGRFSDDRFAILLRRVDSALGRLIAEKMLTLAGAQLGERGGPFEQIKVRAGLAGSGLVERPLDDLLATAIDAVDRARKDGVGLHADIPAAVARGPAKEAQP